MGCFDYRCCVTGLPIRAGDPIKFILLAENPYERDTIIGMGDYWFLRSWPLRGEYNDYGSIDLTLPVCGNQGKTLLYESPIATIGL